MNNNLLNTIREFKSKYGSAKRENIHVYHNGILISKSVGGMSSTNVKGSIKDADVIHNHPTGTPAFSPMDLILTIYGKANSVTAVSANRGSWIMMRNGQQWPDISHNDIENAFNNAIKHEQGLDSTKQLLSDIKSKRISMAEGENIFSERYSARAIRNLGLVVKEVI